MHGDILRHSRTAWKVESIFGVFRSSPFIFLSFFSSALSVFGGLFVHLRFVFFLLFSFLFFCLWADDLNDHHLRQRAASHLRYPRLISASYLHPPNQRACLKSPLSLLRPHTPFYRARIAEHCGFNHTAMEIISISIPTCRSFPFLGLIRVHARRQIQLTLCPLTVTSK